MNNHSSILIIDDINDTGKTLADIKKNLITILKI